MIYFRLLIISLVVPCCLCFGQGPFTVDGFKNPAKEFYPTPFWHINDEMTPEGIVQQITEARDLAKFNGVAVLPVGSTRPSFLSKAYYERYKLILETAKRLDVNVIMYDDTGFPSGTAGGEMETLFPGDLRKVVTKHETVRSGNSYWRMPVPAGQILAAVAMNVESLERVNLGNSIESGWLSWKVPSGTWKIMFFTCEDAPFWKHNLPVDYLDPSAVENFISLTYEKYAEHFGEYFGDTIKISFFDDVGFLRTERAWTPRFNETFSELYGGPPDLMYPALWYDIGPDTAAARVALFNTRAELMAEGFPKKVTEWTRKHGLKNTGHPPGNYAIQPVDMSGDIFKFFRHTDIPLADLIIAYGRGREGFKLMSSASDLYDRPITATEIYGALSDEVVDSKMLYRALMEIQARGINFVVPHGMWYDPTKVSIPPLISPFSEKLAPELPAYSDYTARSCYLLQQGRRVSEIALVYPIASLQAGFYFDSPDNMRAGTWAYPEADYLKISDLLTNEIRRDFTFVHPEPLASETYTVEPRLLRLNNAEQRQEYKTVILPGGSVVSVEALAKIKAFYDAGGNVIATTLLPTKSAELGRDPEVRSLVAAIFGGVSKVFPEVRVNQQGGRATFIADPTKEVLAEALDTLDPNADVIFENPPEIKSKLGVFSYLHKISDGKNLWFFANSSDDTISTMALLRGKHQIRKWNPHTGEVEPMEFTEYVSENDVSYTRFALELAGVEAMFVVSE